MKPIILLASATVLAASLAAVSLAQAQPASSSPQDYQNQQAQYRIAQAQYASQARKAADDRARYEHQRDIYDARYGAGAFARYYAIHPGEYDDRYGPGSYERDFGRPVSYEGPPPH